MRYEYEVWDVFTERALGGNPLALLPDARGLDDASLQAVAREFNLSETSFLLPSERCVARARYFTPTRELPMAGHPTIGTAFALAARGRLPGEEGCLELAAGAMPLRLERAGGELRRVWMDQGAPRRLAEVTARREVAEAMGLGVDDLAADLPLVVASAGVPFLLAPLRSLEALGRVDLDIARLSAWLPAEHRALLAFAIGAGEPRVRCRMFGAALGVREDPATGSAHGPLGAYLVWTGLLDASRGGTGFVSHQGVEMGRASELHVRVRLEGGEPAVEVGGHAVRVAVGSLDL